MRRGGVVLRRLRSRSRGRFVKISVTHLPSFRGAALAGEPGIHNPGAVIMDSGLADYVRAPE